MNRYLSTSEVSKNIGTSIHNIRYYEKEGLLNTPQKSDKGYRLFSFNDIDTLCGIMLLRHSEIPIKKIKELFTDYEPEQFVECLKESSSTIDQEIKRLQNVKADIDQIIADSQFKELGFYQKHIEERTVVIIKTCPYDEELTEREFYNFYVENKHKLLDLDRVELLYILYDSHMTYCLEVSSEVNGIKIKAGQYLCYRFTVDSKACFDYEAEKFIDYIDKNNLKVKGDLALKEIGIESFYYKELDKPVYEYQIRLG